MSSGENRPAREEERPDSTDSGLRLSSSPRTFATARGFLLLACFLSGAAALAYELLWVRELALLVGSTQAAISAVLSAYFLGLALGNYVAGRVALRVLRPLALYAAVEAVIVVWALLFDVLLGGMGQLYATAQAALPAGSGWIHLLRIGCTVGLLLVPTTCMGATLPLLAHFGARDAAGASRWSALLYGFNTLGAMAGTLVTGFYVIEHFGVSGPLRATALLNLACIAAVLPWIRRRALWAEPASTGAESAGAIAPFGRLLLLAFGVLGFCNIAIEVLWTSFYLLIFANDTYAYSTLLLVFLLGVGAGSLAGQQLLARIRRAVYALGLLQLVSAAVSIGMLYYVRPLVLAVAEPTMGFGEHLRTYFIGVGAGTLVPTLCMGASFPLLVRIVLAHRLQTGGIVGRALAWNTLGGVVGASVAGFFLLEKLGIQTGIYAIAGLTAVVGIALCSREHDLPRRYWLPAAGLLLPLPLAIFGPSPRIPESLLEMHFPLWPPTEILEARPSVHGTVAITEKTFRGLTVRQVWINSTWVAHSRAHLSSGYTPWLLRPGPVRSALGICCGTGRTFGALYDAGIPELDLVEINPTVIELSRRWMKEFNHDVLSNPDVRLVIDDGRHFVRYGTGRYDLITIEPLQMFQKGAVYFYTEEFYREARARMSPGGVLCQWLPIDQMSEHELASMVRTFVTVYPSSLLWGRHGPSFMLLGYNAEGSSPDFDEALIYERMESLEGRDDLVQEGLQGRYDPLLQTLIDGDGLRELSRAGEIYTDDRPTLEFTSPRARYAGEANLAHVLAHLTPLSEMFDLPGPRLVEDLERLRELMLRLPLQGDDVQASLLRIRELRQRVYAGDE